MQITRCLYSSRGANISWALIIISTIIACGLFASWQYSDSVVNGIIFYGYPASLGMAVLIYGCFFDQYIQNNELLVETHGYFHWRNRICVKITEIDVMYIISETRTNVDEEKGGSLAEYVRFKLKDGSLSNDFTLCNKEIMVKEIMNINNHVTVVMENSIKN
jgi:hypothetical protein